MISSLSRSPERNPLILSSSKIGKSRCVGVKCCSYRMPEGNQGTSELRRFSISMQTCRTSRQREIGKDLNRFFIAHREGHKRRCPTRVKVSTPWSMWSSRTAVFSSLCTPNLAGGRRVCTCARSGGEAASRCGPCMSCEGRVRMCGGSESK